MSIVVKAGLKHSPATSQGRGYLLPLPSVIDYKPQQQYLRDRRNLGYSNLTTE